MKYSIGIDPGVNGAIVAVDSNYNIVAWRDCPVVQLTKTVKGKKTIKNELVPVEMKNALDSIVGITTAKMSCETKVWLETAQAMPQQGVSSTFKTGRGFGIWEGIIVGLGLTYDLVRPMIWTKIMLQGTPLGEPKQRSLLKAQRLFPTLPLMKPNGRTLCMDGRSDATLIAYYGMMQMLNNNKQPKVIRIGRKNVTTG